MEKVLHSFKSRLFSIKNLDKITFTISEQRPEKGAALAAEPTPKVATGATPTKHKNLN